MTELNQALKLIWSYHDDLLLRGERVKDKATRRLCRAAATALGRTLRPYERPTGNEGAVGGGEVAS